MEAQVKRMPTLRMKYKYGAEIEALQPNESIRIERSEQAKIINYLRFRYSVNGILTRIFQTKKQDDNTVLLFRLK